MVYIIYYKYMSFLCFLFFAAQWQIAPHPGSAVAWPWTALWYQGSASFPPGGENSPRARGPWGFPGREVGVQGILRDFIQKNMGFYGILWDVYLNLW